MSSFSRARREVGLKHTLADLSPLPPIHVNTYMWPHLAAVRLGDTFINPGDFVNRSKSGVLFL